MNKIYLSLYLLFLIPVSLVAQLCSGGSGPSVCTPSGSYTVAGYYPNYDSMPCIVQGVYYDQTIELLVPDSVTIAGLGRASLSYLKIDSITNLPCGMCWATDVVTNQFTGGTLHCIRITGTSYDNTGQFKLNMYLDIRGCRGVSCQTVVNQSAFNYGLGYYLRVTSTGATPTSACACPLIDTTRAGNITTGVGRPIRIVSLISSKGASFCVPGSDTLTASILGLRGAQAQYQWSKDGVLIPCATGRTLPITTGGRYRVYAYTGCMYDSSVEVQIYSFQPPATPVITSNGPSIFCSNDSVTLDAGSGYLAYLWSDNNYYETNTIHTGGIYTVTATDANGCNAVSAPDTITVLAAPIVNLGLDTTVCTPNSVLLDADTGTGYTYLWSTGANSRLITVDTTATYTVTVTAPNSCTASSSRNLTANQKPVVNLGNDTSICSGNSITFDAGNVGGTYYWTPGGFITQTIHANASASYVALVTVNGCSASDTVQLTVNPSPITTVSPVGPVTICSGIAQNLTARASGGTLQWYNGSTLLTGQTNTTLSVSTAGDYYAVSTQGLCADTSNHVTVTLGPILTPNITPVAPIICAGSTTTLDAGSGFASYLWSNAAIGTEMDTVTATGTYYITVTLGGCSGVDSVTVINGSSVPTPTITGVDSVCPSYTTTLDAGAGYTSYLWSNSLGTNETSIVSATGTYSVTVTQTGYCGTASASKQFNISIPPVITLGNDTTVCSASGLILNAGNAGSAYAWSNRTTAQTTAVTGSGQYIVTVTSPFGCTATGAINVTVSQSPLVNLGHDTTICSSLIGIILNAGNVGSTYQWSDGSNGQTLAVDSTNTYSVTVTAANTCTATGARLVTVNLTPAVNLGNDTSICGARANGTLLLDAGNPGARYHWSINNRITTDTTTVRRSGNYSVTVTLNGCSGVDSINVNIGRTPTIFIANDTTICWGSRVGMGVRAIGTGTLTYLWSNGDTARTFSTRLPGHYTVTVTGSGCSDTAGRTISLYPRIIVNIGRDTAICTTAGITLDAGNAGAKYNWSPTADTTRTITVDSTNQYFVTVTVNLCSVRDSIRITNNNFSCSFAANGSLLTAAPLGGTYQWLLGGTAISGAIDSTYTATQTGNYSVQIMHNGCSCATASQTITVVGIQDVAAALNLTAVPNPTSEKVTVMYTLPSESDVQMTIYDVVGNKIATLLNEKQLSSVNYKQEVDLTGVNAGIYLLKVTTEQGIATVRLIKE